MKILGLEKLSLVDYPGNTCAVIFTGGCNFRCPFCHNSGLVLEDQEELSVLEVLSFLKKRYGLLDSVVVSGGEPTLQPDLMDFLKKLKDIGYKVKLDTNGTNPKMLKEIIDNNLVDYIAMDIKNNLDNYGDIIGLPCYKTGKVLESINILKENRVDYEFRTTLVNEYHSIENIKKMKEELLGAKRLYLQRFVDNDNCLSSGLTSVSMEDANLFKEELSKSIPSVNLRGYI